MQVINKFMMFILIVSDMQKAKEFYSEKLGLKITKDYRQDDDHWWVSVVLPEGGVTITLTTYHERVKPGAMVLYFITKDIDAAHKELGNKNVRISEMKDDLFGPGSGVKWFEFEDPDGNQILMVPEGANL